MTKKSSSEKSALRRAISRQVYRSHERLLEEALEQTPEVTDLLKLREMYPQYDEEKLLRLQRLNEKINQSVVYGDEKTYLVALIVSESNENKKEIEIYLEDLNKTLSLVEKVKKFKLIKEEFTIENGMLTPTLKLKRKKILEKYEGDLEKLY